MTKPTIEPTLSTRNHQLPDYLAIESRYILQSKFESGAKEIIQPEIFVEFVVKPVEIRY